MQKEIHPELKELSAKCATCSAEHKFSSTKKQVSIDVCSSCHAFYTGNSSAIKATGRVERFNRMLNNQNNKK